ncbi:MAG: NUDIX hydrolase [Candidatus Thorarchaeota archaeon]|jgi:dATP pyrophosphohydrolase
MSLRVPIQVLVYPVRYKDDNWEYLLLKRVEDRGGFWQGVTGAPEKKEKILEAAKRELLEETGFLAEIIFKVDYTYSINVKDVQGVYAPDVATIPEYAFMARVHEDSIPVLDPIEHTEWMWCTFDEAYELLKWENNKKALEVVRSMLVE